MTLFYNKASHGNPNVILEEEINQSKLTLNLFLNAWKHIFFRDSCQIQWLYQMTAAGLESFLQCGATKKAYWFFSDFSIASLYPFLLQLEFSYFLVNIVSRFIFSLWYDDELVMYWSVCNKGTVICWYMVWCLKRDLFNFKRL